ncbi:MAG: hypothetical protein A2Y97_02590 [Nitrospirae bacterium RBG_13_39_12]|nr:MAG: hypothetical protein A2Y97_02590 [Nitrospirae bacterium RBG_13_39_12]
MRKLALWIIICVLIVSSFFLQGCATDKPFAKKDIESLSPIKVVRYETPGILRSTVAETFLLTGAAVALPGGSALFFLSDEYCKARGGDMQTRIPDFGYLVMQKFTEKMNQGTSKWPELTFKSDPVVDDFTEPCTLIEIKVKRLAYGYLDFIRGGGNGFLSKTTITMKDSQDEVLWQKSFTYLSKDFERDKDIDEFEADDAKLLKEEIDFAAEKTVSDFINHLNGEKPQEYAQQ